MKVKEYFLTAFKSLATFFVMFAKGLYFAVKRLFLEYPHPTYITIIIMLVAVFILKYTKVCAEREDYNHKAYLLQEKIDSLGLTEFKYQR